MRSRLQPARTTETGEPSSLGGTQSAAVHRSRLGLPLLFLVALGSALLVAHAIGVIRSPFVSLAASIQDDAFYYLVPAWRFHQDLFFTFDGQHATSGFQPLYMLLLSGLAVGFDGFESFVRASLVLNASCHVGAGVLIYLASRRLLGSRGKTGPLLASVGALAYLTNAAVFALMTTAMENAVYSLLVAMAFLALTFEVPTRTAPLVGVGGLAGGLLLARLLPGSLLLSIWLVARTAGRDGARWARVLAGAAAVLVPWILYALWAFGSVTPISGQVKMAHLSNRVSSGQWLEDLPMMLAAGWEHLFAVLRLSGGDPSRFVVTRSLISGEGPFPPGLALVLPLAGVLGLLLWIADRRRVRRAVDRSGVTPAWVGLSLVAIGHLTTGSLYAHRGGEIWYTSWYAVELPVAIAVLAPTVALSWPAHREAGRAVRLLLLAAVGGLAVVSVPWGRLLQPLPPIPSNRYSWPSAILQASSAARDRIELTSGGYHGAYNAGFASVVLGGRMVNLDGLANNDIVDRRSQPDWNLLGYLRENRIESIVDVISSEGFFGNHFAYYQVIETVPFELFSIPGYYVVRVTDEPFPELESLPPDAVEIIYGRPTTSEWTCRDRVLSIGEPAEVRFRLGHDYSSMRARATVHAPGGGSAWKLSASLDGRSLGDWPVRTGESTPIRLDVADGQVLTFEASPSDGQGPMESRLELCEWSTRPEASSVASLRARSREPARK